MKFYHDIAINLGQMIVVLLFLYSVSFPQIHPIFRWPIINFAECIKQMDVKTAETYKKYVSD